MIKEVAGDILLSKAEAVAHGVAPNDDFHSGLALALRERWPGMYKDFRHYCRLTHAKPGTHWAWMGPNSPKIVALFTQEGSYEQGAKPGRAKLEHVGHAVQELRKIIEKENIKSIALPRLATGVGGLDWADVKPILEKNLSGLGTKVYVYSTFHKGQQAVED